jgi:hypothetical protein
MSASTCPTLWPPGEGPDVLVYVTAVGVQRLARHAELAEVAVQQLSHRGGGPRVAPLIDLVDQPDPRRFCLRCGLRARVG